MLCYQQLSRYWWHKANDSWFVTYRKPQLFPTHTCARSTTGISTDNQVKRRMTETCAEEPAEEPCAPLTQAYFCEELRIFGISQKQIQGSFPSVYWNSSNLLKNMAFKKVKYQPTAFTSMVLFCNGGIHSWGITLFWLCWFNAGVFALSLLRLHLDWTFNGTFPIMG